MDSKVHISDEEKYPNDFKQYRPVYFSSRGRIEHEKYLLSFKRLQTKIYFILKVMIVSLFIWLTVFVVIYDKKDEYPDDIFDNLVENHEKIHTLPLKQAWHVETTSPKIPPLAKKNKKNDFHGGEPLLPEEHFEEEEPGEGGKEVILPSNMSEDMKNAVDEGWKLNAFNQYASDLISLKRSLPDIRDPWCKEPGRYLSDLPDTSIIICFHNEAWSALLRTVHSVLDRSPEKLVKEIILVDDFSYLVHTQKPLEDYLMNYPKVKVVRTAKREGLIRARLFGAQHATASVLTFLDSHCECTSGWLEPLLDRIARDPTTVVCPAIDTIDDTTFKYNWHGNLMHVGGFNWNLQFRWHLIPDREKRRHKHHAEPVWSPTMAGGLFSIDKAFFEKLGTYDPGFDIWGGENLELSFKTWMCGGTLEILPCSHVGHVFRKRSPYKWGKKGENVVLKNSVRLAKVWLDDYAKFYYDTANYKHNYDIGDISERLALRKNLNCKSFDWYMKNVYPELYIPSNSIGKGEIRNLGDGYNNCLDSGSGRIGSMKSLKMFHCHGQGGNQYWLLSQMGEIRREEFCLDSSDGKVFMYRCHSAKGNQLWAYDSASKLIKHISNKCLAVSVIDDVIVENCNHANMRHKWQIQEYNASMTLPLK